MTRPSGRLPRPSNRICSLARNRAPSRTGYADGTKAVIQHGEPRVVQGRPNGHRQGATEAGIDSETDTKHQGWTPNP